MRLGRILHRAAWTVLYCDDPQGILKQKKKDLWCPSDVDDVNGANQELQVCLGLGSRYRLYHWNIRYIL